MTLRYPKHVPYKGTAVPPEKSRNQIEKLLYDYGAEQVQVTTSADGHAKVIFLMEVPKGEATKRIGIEIRVPVVTQTARVWDEKVSRVREREVPNLAVGWRITYHYILTKLQASVSGLMDFEHEWLADTVIRDASGRSITVAEAIIPILDRNRGMLALPPASAKPNATDTEYRTVEP